MSTPRTDPDLEQLVGPIPEWRAHARAAARAWLRSWVPYRTWSVVSGLPPLVVHHGGPPRPRSSPYLVLVAWHWRGRIIHRASHRAW